MKIQTQLVLFGIMSIPTLLFKKDGQVVKQVAGVHTAEQIKAIVAELRLITFRDQVTCFGLFFSLPFAIFQKIIARL